MASAKSALSFEQALQPMSWPAFLESHWTQDMLRLQGHADKFASVLTWDDLNHVVEQHRLGPPRLQLFRDGRIVPPASYRLRGDDAGIDTAGLAAALSGGCTLIVNGIEEMVPSVRHFAESLDSLLGGATLTAVNVYAGWGSQKGFDLHWDNHEITVLQVAGRKHWTVYRPTSTHPVDKGAADQPDETDLAWEGVLEQGDFLYLPRGWWHVARPLDEASLHLTVTTPLPRGDHFLAWLAGEHPDTRADLPFWDGRQQRQAYLERVGRAVAAALNEDAFTRFLAAREAALPVRRRISLPALPQPPGSITMATLARLTRRRRVVVRRDVDAGAASFMLGETRWECEADVLPAVAALRHDPQSVGLLCAALTEADARSRFLRLLVAMALKGEISLTAE